MRSLILLLVLASAAAVRADVRSDDLKRQGLEAAQRKDWELARQKFEASFAIDPRPLTLYNLAAAQEHTGRLVAARTSYRSFLATSVRDDSAARFVKIAQDKLATLEQAIPTLQVRITGFGAGAVVQLDGRTLASAELAAPIPLDPGSHVAIASEGVRIARREVVVERGQRIDVELTAPVVERPPPPPPVVVTPKPRAPVPPPPKERSIFASGWFWGATAVVLVGAAAGGYYVVYGNPFVEDPMRGTLGAGVIELP